MKEILKKIRQDLKLNAEIGYQQSVQHFFKEKIKVYGVRAGLNRKIGKKYLSEIKRLSKKEILFLSEELLESGYFEEAGLAFNFISSLEKQYKKSDFLIFEKWLKKYVDNWAKCDVFCGEVLGPFLFLFPELAQKINSWTKSENRWVRRAAAVILIYPLKKKKYLEKVFEISNLLLTDSDEMVQKGYGWLLKETSNFYPRLIFDYVMKNKKKMPRTALRYAIEKLPLKLKKEAMK